MANARAPVARPTIAIDARYLRRRGVGIAEYLAQMLDELVEADSHLVLLTDDADHAHELAASYPNAGVGALATVSGFWWEQWSLLWSLRRMQPDLFIAPSNWGLPLFYAGRTRLVVVVHDLIPLRMPRVYLAGKPKWGLKYLLSTAITAVRADWVITNSLATAAEVRRFWRKHRITTVYPLAVSAPYRGKTDAPARSSIAINGDVPVVPHYFVYTGGNDPRKNVDCLLRAFKLLTESGDPRPLYITGSNTTELKHLVDRMGIEDRVVFPGYVSIDERDLLVQGADALIYPSLMEGLGLPVIEALRFATPVVCARLPSILEIAGDLPIYTDVESATALANAMRLAGSDSARRALEHRAPEHLAGLAKRDEAKGIVSALQTILHELQSTRAARIRSR